ncbi:unnamed protein product [Enterobius vermicularis]|uniref:SUN domain-containing protein n=1 Tax=Enterobius vermicularis TaxID=51028 RepID=A0A3P6HLY6_ENTVE|nr:unnamed protein product [Enterobius vermicularis]
MHLRSLLFEVWVNLVHGEVKLKFAFAEGIVLRIFISLVFNSFFNLACKIRVLFVYKPLCFTVSLDDWSSFVGFTYAQDNNRLRPVLLGASVISTRCTKSYEKKSRLESLFGISLYYSNYSPRQVIQHRSSFASGECWSFEGTGYLVIKLSHPVYVTEISYEHLPLCLYPDGNMKSAPKLFQIWVKPEDLSSKYLIGEYEYNISGQSLQTFPAQNIPPDPTSFIELIVLSNWGASYTCLYRLRVHGKLPTNATV